MNLRTTRMAVAVCAVACLGLGAGCSAKDGTAGAAGVNSLVNVSVEPAGPNCATGGQRIESGLDDNGDGALQPAEVDNTSYACNGTDGLVTLLVITPEPWGVNCGYAGQKVEAGADDNRDGTLQPAEVDQTAYVCNAPGSVERLLIVASTDSSWVTCVATGLAPYFGTVTWVAGVPTHDELGAADAVLVYNNGGNANAAALGDALADFHDARGHVVEGLYGTGGLDAMAGRWATDGYGVLSGTWSAASLTLGTVAEPTPIMVGVASLATIRSVNGSAINGGTVVASWSNGMPIAVRGAKNGHNRVDLGLFPGGCNGGYWTGDGFALMANALKY